MIRKGRLRGTRFQNRSIYEKAPQGYGGKGGSMHFLDKRVNVICDELKKLQWKQKFPVTDWKYKEGNYIHPQDAEADSAEWKDFDSKDMHWYGPDRHYWFKAVYKVPQELDGKRMWMRVRTQINEWDDAKNPQFLLFVNGTATQGMDMNHKEVFLREKAVAGEELVLELQAYTGTLHNEFKLFVDMCEVDALVTKVFYDLWVPLSAFPRMNEDDKIRRDIENVLNETVNFIDLRTPYSEEFYSTLQQASDYIDKALYTDMAGYKDVIATCIGHTHIDVAWWWTVEQTREKTGRSFATVLKLMEEYPNYRFMSSQPQLYAFLKERYPELYARVKEMVKEYQRRRDYAVKAINEIPGLHCECPKGAFYIFINCKSLNMKSADLAAWLLENAKIALVPGDVFGPGGEGYLRMSFANSYENVVEGCAQLKKAVALLQQKP